MPARALVSVIAGVLCLSVHSTALAQKRGGSPIVPLPQAPVFVKGTSTGTFVDRENGKHTWTINAAHTLLWDNRSYIPVGCTWHPTYFSIRTESAWKQDVAQLVLLKSKGVTDIVLSPAQPILSVPAASLQRVLDYLEANDFRYGLDFGDGITTPLTGTIVKPATYRFADTRDALTVNWRVANADSGLYTIVDTADDSKIIRAGFSPSRDDNITAPLDESGNNGKLVAILYPHKTVPLTEAGVLPDLWSAFDDYRDHILAYLSQIKFGKGLRFFLDPLANRIGLLNETDYLIPDSVNFGLEWEAFLIRRYSTVDEAKLAWQVTDDAIKTYQNLAHLIPLWANSNGIPNLYDRVANRFYRVTDARQSRWWQDFLECRNQSIQFYMSSIADVVKQVADVPVVYRWVHNHPIFTNPNQDSGFDGLCVTARGESMIARTLGPALSAAEQSNRTQWCIASGIQGSASAQTNTAPHTTVASVQESVQPTGTTAISQADLFRTVDTLRKAGWKGFFVDNSGDSPSREAPLTTANFNPEILDGLHTYAERVRLEPNAGTYLPRILFFPQNAPGPAHVGLVPGTTDVLWLNTFDQGEAVDWWPCYRGYSIVRPQAPLTLETVVVSLQGRKETHLALVSMKLGDIPNARAVQAFTPDGLPVPFRVTGPSAITLTLDETPTVFKTPGYKLIPEEAAITVVNQLAALILRATEQHVPAVDSEQAPLDAAKYDIMRKDFENGYWRARTALDELTAIAEPYIWIEGESAKLQTFTEVAPNVEASNGYFLRLYASNPPTRLGYGARYYFTVPHDGKYNVWLAGSLPGPGTSPIKWKVNSEPERDPVGTVPAQPLYVADRFGWTLLGTVALSKGQGQSLGIFVTDRARSPREYIFSIDSLLLTTENFTPNGTVRPVPMLIKYTPNMPKNKRKDKG